MAKVSAKQIDIDERKVIAVLQKNAKESIDSIAADCGFSRQKVWRIIKRLEKNKTIWGYHAVVDSDKIQMKRYLLLIRKTTEPVKELAEIIISRGIEKYAQEVGVYLEDSQYLHGMYDWEMCFSAKDIKQAKQFCETLNKVYHKYIKELFLLERIFPVKLCGLQNPNIMKLKGFV
jgi:DNA-binding Lrp family transcriptional regulator